MIKDNMENQEKYQNQESEPRITENELRTLDVKTVKEIQDRFGVSYEGLKKFSAKEIDILARDAKAIKEQIDTDEEFGLTEEQKKEQKSMAKDMYERLLKDAEESGNEEKIKIYRGALKAIEEEQK